MRVNSESPVTFRAAQFAESGKARSASRSRDESSIEGPEADKTEEGIFSKVLNAPVKFTKWVGGLLSKLFSAITYYVTCQCCKSEKAEDEEGAEGV